MKNEQKKYEEMDKVDKEKLIENKDFYIRERQEKNLIFLINF